MIDNEQRAHDLAVAMLPTIFELIKTTGIIEASERRTDDVIEDVRINIYTEYMKLYDAGLEAFNKHMPNR